jgi:hypothetical protein
MCLAADNMTATRLLSQSCFCGTVLFLRHNRQPPHNRAASLFFWSGTTWGGSAGFGKLGESLGQVAASWGK